jgi:hypothetical protein
MTIRNKRNGRASPFTRTSRYCWWVVGCLCRQFPDQCGFRRTARRSIQRLQSVGLNWKCWCFWPARGQWDLLFVGRICSRLRAFSVKNDNDYNRRLLTAMKPMIDSWVDFWFFMLALLYALWFLQGGALRLAVVIRRGRPLNPSIVRLVRAAALVTVIVSCLVLAQFLFLHVR